jgi:hypothetical protein
LKNAQRGLSLNKPPAKKLALRVDRPAVKKQETKTKQLDPFEQDMMDYDLGDILEFVKGKQE